jgi:radical SAM superfamily enzyme YgiQ (UPF0313 family)
MPRVVLSTLNARFAHASLGLRCLRANLGDLREDTVIREFVVRTSPERIVADLLALGPRIVAFGVYIWNVDATTRAVELLKAAAPQVIVVLGGPEVSHETEAQPIVHLADHVITGWGEITFARLVHQLLDGPRPLTKIHAGEQPPLGQLLLPYAEYTDADLRHRHVYVEASRGCPFKCEFCLSALDRTAWAFPLEPFLDDIDALWRRGARRFRFVDRTFNLRIGSSLAILEYFLRRLREAAADPPFLHFEMIPDRLPEALREPLARFPPGSLQLEIGIQTFNPDVQASMSRHQDNALAEANLLWLRRHTHAHLHVDLIAGLPGEDIASFAAGFDRLVALGPQEIQVGLLKRLRGAPIVRHTTRFAMQYGLTAPYEVISTGAIDAETMLRIKRFARYWDRIASSGRFPRALSLLLGDSPFADFMALSDWLYQRTSRTCGLSAEELAGHVYAGLLQRGVDAAEAREALVEDYRASGAQGRLGFASLPRRRRPAAALSATPERQRRHLRSPQ